MPPSNTFKNVWEIDFIFAIPLEMSASFSMKLEHGFNVWML